MVQKKKPLEDNNVDKDADLVLTKWLECIVDYNKFRYRWAPRIVNPERVSIIQLIQRFDTTKYFRLEGWKSFPSICLLARVHLGKFANAGFQERVFSTAGNAMGLNQSRMSFDRLEMCTLISHNKDLIHEGVF